MNPAHPLHPWSVGDHLTHRFNPELGTGRVSAIEGRVLVVQFAKAGRTLRIAATSDALVREDPEAPSRSLSLPERLARGDADDARDFLMRLDMLRLLETREAGGLGSFLGGRIRLFPHQLYVAERATAAMPVRWLLADEVGLGKTIEAALILNRLVHTTNVERCLVVAPESLTVQWLGELWRKYHQVFTLLDSARLADVARDFGRDFNPFDVHRRAIVALETLVERPEVTGQAVKAGIDLLVVDEAQRLRRRPGHPGEPAYRAIASIAALGRHVLLLSATPLEDDAHGFFRLLQLLRPDEFPAKMNFDARLASGTPLPPCTSSTRRSDIGGLPPRVAAPVDLPDEGPIDDPNGSRAQWLLKAARRWRQANEKTLVFVARRETLEMLRSALSDRAHIASGAFHEDLPAARRDLEIARFRAEDGPSILVSTEAGGEGRNFEFCHRLVLYDLPRNPATVEQRIGRLDRIGRRIPVEIIYFRPPSGSDADAARFFERLGIFETPLTGLPDAPVSEDQVEQVVSEAQAARARIRAAAFQELHRDPYRPDMAAPILARVPVDLDAQMESVITRAAYRLGFRVEQVRGRRAYAIEFGNEALIDSLPGVPGGSSFIGSFDREYAVENETTDFFASGHSLVEGLLDHYEDDPAGRVAFLDVTLGGPPGVGLVAIYKDGVEFDVVALDSQGRSRADWANAFRSAELRAKRMGKETRVAHDFASLIPPLAAKLEADRRPYAVAAIAVRPTERAGRER